MSSFSLTYMYIFCAIFRTINITFLTMSNVNQQINIFKQEGKKFTLRYSGRQLWYSSEKSTFEIIRHSRENLSSKYQEQASHKCNRKRWLSALHRLMSSRIKLNFYTRKLRCTYQGRK